MKRVFVARLALLVLSMSSGSGHADPSSDFRTRARARARKLSAGVARWGSVQLDEDPALERFAVICAETGDAATILLEKDRASRWSMTTELDGRNGCSTEGPPRWEALEDAGFPIYTSYHHGQSTHFVALRGGTPVVVRTRTETSDIPRGTSNESDDFDRLLHTEQHGAPSKRRPHAEDAMDLSPVASSAIFVLDGASGAHRSRTGSGDVPALEIVTRPSGKRAEVAVTLSRPAALDEAIEVWSVTSTGEPMGWAARWNGTAWRQTGVGRAPRELPGVKGDATHVTVPIVRRDGDVPLDGTPLCIAWHSPTRADRTSTCDLDPKLASSLGRLYAASARVPTNLKRQ